MSSLTGDRGFVGTIDYVPPEQIAGGAIDRRADVYSLGCVLFECLAGARPFERESELSVVFAHLNEPPPRLSDFRPELPRAFDDVFATALAKSPDERYGTCGELVAAARAALRGETIRRRAGSSAAPRSPGGRGGVARGRGDRDRRHPRARDEASPAAVSISQTSIAGGSSGRRRGVQAAVRARLALGHRHRARLPGLIFVHRRQSIYFDPDTRRSIIVTTWNRITGRRPASAPARASKSSSPPTAAR